MAIDSLQDIVDRVEAVGERMSAARAVLADLVATNSQSARDVLQAASVATGVQAEIRAIRAEIDVIDAVDYLPVQDGQSTLSAWIWQRSLRRDLAIAGAAAGRLVEIANELVSGLQRRTILVREGDTWQGLAARELGNWTAWQDLWRANDQYPPTAPPSGALLVVPQPR